MHSSRMRTVCSSSHVYPSMHWAGGCVYPSMHWAGGVYLGGVCLGVSARGGGGCLTRGVQGLYPSIH